MKDILPFITLLLSLSVQAQTSSCNVTIDSAHFVAQPHYGSNQVLQDVSDIIHAKRQEKSATLDYLSNDALFNVPVKIWIYHDDDGSSQAMPEADALRMISFMNRDFANNNTDIRFYNKCAIEHVNSTEFNIINSQNELDDMWAAHTDEKALNWHIIIGTDYEDSVNDWAGIARLPTGSDEDFNIAFVSAWASISSTIVTHEIGHSFGLLHTHDLGRNVDPTDNNGDATNECYQESVSRGRANWIVDGCIGTHGKRKCEVNGDGLCDTEASPRDLRPDLFWCIYLGNEEDLWGDIFRPDTRNYMAYTSVGCQDEFTSNQISVMHMSLIDHMQENGYPWYNRNILALTGEANFGDEESFNSPERIEVAFDDPYTIHAGGKVELLAQREIRINSGFHAKAGSKFYASIGTITDCNTVTADEKSASKTKFLSKTHHYDMESKVKMLIADAKRKKEMEAKNLRFLIREHLMNRSKNDFTLYPNPLNKENLTLDIISIKNQSVRVEINSTIGNLIELRTQHPVSKGHNTITLYLNNIPSGFYLVRVTYENGKVKTQKLTKL